MKRIIVENISKAYQLGTSAEKEISFRELLFSQVGSFFLPSGPKKTFFALKDLSFEVEEGEVLGIIGRNGSGKSTLLKILSRITPPTKGRAIINGRVASLLEVGTGFHAELSGRENIYLSGVILGMKRWEISAHFDEIVTFAEIEGFLDVPVKKYSSGMRLRLAFAIAAYLRPEILLIDEVLAVGDYEFEKKCIRSMGELGKAGRTILFVSHNLAVVKSLCSRVLVLCDGSQKFLGAPNEATKVYFGGEVISRSSMIWDGPGLRLGEVISLHSMKVVGASGNDTQALFLDEKIIIEVTYQWLTLGYKVSIIISFYDETETLLFSTSKTSDELNEGTGDNFSLKSLFVIIPGNIFQEGAITVGLTIFNLGKFEKLIDADLLALLSERDMISFFMKERETQKIAGAGSFWRGQKGKIRPLIEWKM